MRAWEGICYSSCPCCRCQRYGCLEVFSKYRYLYSYDCGNEISILIAYGDSIEQALNDH